MIRRLLLLDPKPVEGNGTPTSTPTPTTEGTPDLAKAAEGLVAKHGDQTAALKVLLAENYQYREDLRQTKARLPGEGARVLTAEEAQALESYRALGKPEELATVKAEHGTLAGELSGLRREREVQAFAARTGVNAEVLATLAGKLDLSATVKAVDPRTKKEIEVPAVKDGEGEPVAFEAYAAKHWAAFLPALRAASGPAQPEGPNVPPRRQAAPMPPVNLPKPAAPRLAGGKF